ncbi:MAG: extracellular solute-binding protein [Odoribacter splanchnicus]
MLLSWHRIDGNQYAIPFFGESSFIMYNIEKFEEAGITVTENPTREEIYGWAQALTDKQNEEYGFAAETSDGVLAGVC